MIVVATLTASVLGGWPLASVMPVLGALHGLRPMPATELSLEILCVLPGVGLIPGMFEPVMTASADPPDPPRDQRLYRRIAATLRDRIESGELARGTRMPGTRAIKDEFSTSQETAQKALRVLEAEGIIKKWPGVGSGATSQHWRTPSPWHTRGRSTAFSVLPALRTGHLPPRRYSNS